MEACGRRTGRGPKAVGAAADTRVDLKGVGSRPRAALQSKSHPGREDDGDDFDVPQLAAGCRPDDDGALAALVLAGTAAASVDLSASSASLVVGQTVTLTANVKDAS